MSPRTTHPLSAPSDHLVLAEAMCLVRSALEAFVVTAADAEDETIYKENARARLSDGVVDVGRVGIRCIYCHSLKGGGEADHPRSGGVRRAPNAATFPKSVKLVYQAARNWQRYHLMSCPAVPGNVKERYVELKRGAKRGRSTKASPQYWEKCCRKMGMVDGGELGSEEGIRLRTGEFEDGAEDVATLEARKCDAPRSSTSISPSDSAFESSASPGAGSTSGLPDCAEAQGSVSARFSSESPPAPELMNMDVRPTTADRSRKEEIFGSVDNFTNAERLSDEAGSVADPVFSDNITRDATAVLPGASSVQEQPALGGDALLGLLDYARGHESTFALPERQNDLFLSNGFDSLSISEDVATMTEKLVASLSIVHAVRRKRYVPSVNPGHKEGSLNGEGASLSLIGAELYELFAGIPPFNKTSSNGVGTRNESNGDGMAGHPGEYNDDCDNLAHRRKRDQRRKTDDSERRKSYVPLVELGAPPAVCALVSRLLDHKSHDEFSGGINGNGNRWHCRGLKRHDFLVEVEEDLHFLAARPELLLANRLDYGELQIPPNDNAIFGREEEMDVLIAAYDRATNQETCCGGRSVREAVLLSGYSGTGKSSLVEHTRSHLVQKGASFVFGKFDAMLQLSPLSAIVSAVGGYCDLLAKDNDRIEGVRIAVTAAIGGGEGSRILTSLVPNMRKIVNIADERVSSSNRQLTTSGRDVIKSLAFQFRKFFGATCSRENPVVMCLDDLQWADEVSLELMHALVMDSEIQGLLFIGCFRDNEVGADHPLMARLESIRQSGNVNTSNIHLGNLDIKHLNELVSESLRLPPGTTLPLAEVVLSKTDGNALFSVQFLASLRDEGLLYFSLTPRRWEWDIKQILSKDISDNVVELMVVKLPRLELGVQEALKVAATFGSQSHESLFEIIDRSTDNAVSTVSCLDIAVMEGLMIKSGPSYRFSHDQIQCAAYALNPEIYQSSFHLRIGRLLWKLASDEELGDNLFIVVDQLHRGASLITDKSEKINLCQLYLLAGQKSSDMSAFLPACSYINMGINLLADDDDWETNRGLCFELYNSCAEIEYVLGEYASMNDHIETVLKKASTLHEELRASYTRVQSLGSMGYISDAFNTAVAVLSQLGESLPTCVTEATSRSEMAMTHALLLSKSDNDILGLPLMENPEKLAAMKFLQLITFYAFTEKKEYFPVVVFRMARLSLSIGICKESCFGFASYGAFISLSDNALAYRVGRISMILLKRFDAKEYLAKVYSCVYGFINPMKEPIQALLPSLKEAVETGLATGDTEFAMTVAHVYGCDSMFSGKSLAPLKEEVDNYLKLMLELKQHFVISLNRPLHDFILKLHGTAAIPMSHACEISDVDESMTGTHSNQLVKMYHIWYNYLFGMYDLAWETIEGGVAGERFSHACTCTFYTCLTALALARKERKTTYMDAIDRGFAQIKTCAASTPWNCEHKMELLKAEYAHLEGHIHNASEAYDIAIDLAQKRSFVHEQALALERAGIFYLENFDNSKASEYFSKAYDCYEKWGAHSKSAYIKEHYM